MMRDPAAPACPAISHAPDPPASPPKGPRSDRSRPPNLPRAESVPRIRNAIVTRSIRARRPTPTSPRRLAAPLANTPALALALAMAGLMASASPAADGPEPKAAARYREEIEPILAEHCFGCHGNGLKKGSVALDAFADDDDLLGRRPLWNDVLKNVRAGLMPPADKPRPSADEVRKLEDWIKRDAFQLDPAEPDPGRVTLHRLNRVEYRNTIRDLMGIDFRADEEFPADDAGYGFDNIGDVLSVSPLLLEKYMQAAETIVAQAVPTVPRVIRSRTYTGVDFRSADDRSAERMSVYREAKAVRAVEVDKGGPHRLTVDLSVRGDFDFDPGRARVGFRLDDAELSADEIAWEAGRKIHREFALDLPAGKHTLAIEVQPLVPVEQKKTSIDLRVDAVRLDGPLAEADWVRPTNFDRFFRGDAPADLEGRRRLARDAVARFAARAFRRPVDDRTVGRLVAIAEDAYGRPGQAFEGGIARAMVAVLASPRFLFRVEGAEAAGAGRISAPVDEFALASRLSYFLWSTTPDEELTRLAARGELRGQFKPQVRRMLADDRSAELVRNFVGQWLQARDFDSFPIQYRAIFRREGKPLPSGTGNQVDGQMRALKRAMRGETEAYFAHVLHEDRPILEFLDSDYAFLNEALAKHYEIPGVAGVEIRKVALPPGSPRGGLLTQAGVLMITSNPSRTSPVKRGQFLLENILGTPTPPPPPDIPSLEDTLKAIQGREPTMREVMAAHRENALCASCHNRMDPLGLAFENFNAMGTFRPKERGQAGPIDASGTLVTGRKFADAVALKSILVAEYRDDFYRCLTEKLLTYALGRGVDYYDVEAIDQVVARLDRDGGRFSALLMGVLESAPFQRRRLEPTLAASNSNTPATPPAAALGAKP